MWKSACVGIYQLLKWRSIHVINYSLQIISGIFITAVIPLVYY